MSHHLVGLRDHGMGHGRAPPAGTRGGYVALLSGMKLSNMQPAFTPISGRFSLTIIPCRCGCRSERSNSTSQGRPDSAGGRAGSIPMRETPQRPIFFRPICPNRTTERSGCTDRELPPVLRAFRAVITLLRTAQNGGLCLHKWNPGPSGRSEAQGLKQTKG